VVSDTPLPELDSCGNVNLLIQLRQMLSRRQ
jgi:hypothetical protein